MINYGLDSLLTSPDNNDDGNDFDSPASLRDHAPDMEWDTASESVLAEDNDREFDRPSVLINKQSTGFSMLNEEEPLISTSEQPLSSINTISDKWQQSVESVLANFVANAGGLEPSNSANSSSLSAPLQETPRISILSYESDSSGTNTTSSPSPLPDEKVKRKSPFGRNSKSPSNNDNVSPSPSNNSPSEVSRKRFFKKRQSTDLVDNFVETFDDDDKPGGGRLRKLDTTSGVPIERDPVASLENSGSASENGFEIPDLEAYVSPPQSTLQSPLSFRRRRDAYAIVTHGSHKQPRPKHRDSPDRLSTTSFDQQEQLLNGSLFPKFDSGLDVITQATIGDKFGESNFSTVSFRSGTMAGCVRVTKKYMHFETGSNMIAATMALGFQTPQLLLSVLGGAKELSLPNGEDALLKQGLRNVIDATSAWVLTSGLNCGVSKLVGQAVADLRSS
eukprot:m.156255 g.156255  ORF g.156255 m.156255 type:complete len:448 (-) comp30982_c1_seq1:3408-4751(-)